MILAQAANISVTKISFDALRMWINHSFTFIYLSIEQKF